MLKGISPVVSPDLLKTLAEMGHGDEIVIADAHFPGHTFNSRVLRGALQPLAGALHARMDLTRISYWRGLFRFLSWTPTRRLSS